MRDVFASFSTVVFVIMQPIIRALFPSMDINARWLEYLRMIYLDFPLYL